MDDKYGQEIHKLNITENRMRMMLYTNHLPLNSHQRYVLGEVYRSPLGDHSNCRDQIQEGTLHHDLFMCPKNSEKRTMMINNIKKV